MISIRFAAALTFLVAGCGSNWTGPVRRAASQEHHCAEARVRLVSDDGNRTGRTAQLDVCGERRVYRDTGVRGSTVWMDVTPATSSVTTSTEGSGRVERVRSETGDDWVLRAESQTSGYTLRWLATPERSRTEIGLTLAAPTNGARSACPVRAMVDGSVSELGATQIRTVHGEDRILMVQPAEWARAVAAASRVTIRVCGEEIRFGPQDLAIVRELLTRFDEEGAWTDPSGAP